MKYLKNPYVLVGLLGIGYFSWKRKKLKNQNIDFNKPLSEIKDVIGMSDDSVDTKSIAKENKVPEKLVKDVMSMGKKKLARAILVNQEMLNREKMDNDERNHILKMVDYMEQELEKIMANEK